MTKSLLLINFLFNEGQSRLFIDTNVAVISYISYICVCLLLGEQKKKKKSLAARALIWIGERQVIINSTRNEINVRLWEKERVAPQN